MSMSSSQESVGSMFYICADIYRLVLYLVSSGSSELFLTTRGLWTSTFSRSAEMLVLGLHWSAQETKEGERGDDLEPLWLFGTHSGYQVSNQALPRCRICRIKRLRNHFRGRDGSCICIIYLNEAT